MRNKLTLSMDGYQHRSHNKNLLYAHIIFVVKYSKPLLRGAIDQDVNRRAGNPSTRSNRCRNCGSETQNEHKIGLIQLIERDPFMGLSFFYISHAILYVQKSLIFHILR